MKKLLIALAAVALLGGCVKMDKSPPKDLPAYAAIYPGATQTVSMNVGPMTMIIFQAAASPDDVVGYYRSLASSNGLEETNAPAKADAPPEQRQATFQDPATKRVFVVLARPQAAGSMVSLSYTKGNGQ